MSTEAKRLMSQTSLTRMFRARGWGVIDTKQTHNDQMRASGADDLLKGIALRAQTTNGYTISVGAGGSNYSTPRGMSIRYAQVEFAILDPNGHFMKPTDIVHRDDDVVGFASFSELMDAVRTVEGWGHEKPDPPKIIRRNPVWK